MIEVMSDVHDLINPSSSAERAATAELAIEMVRSILARADQLETSDDRATMAQLEGVVTDPDGVAFVMAFVDRVIRPDDDVVAAKQLAGIVGRNALPGFLSSIDRALLSSGDGRPIHAAGVPCAGPHPFAEDAARRDRSGVPCRKSSTSPRR